MTVRHPGRKAVSERLRAFIAARMREFTTSAHELWKRAEQRRAEKPPEENTPRQG